MRFKDETLAAGVRSACANQGLRGNTAATAPGAVSAASMASEMASRLRKKHPFVQRAGGVEMESSACRVLTAPEMLEL